MDPGSLCLLCWLAADVKKYQQIVLAHSVPSASPHEWEEDFEETLGLFQRFESSGALMLLSEFQASLGSHNHIQFSRIERLLKDEPISY